MRASFIIKSRPAGCSLHHVLCFSTQVFVHMHGPILRPSLCNHGGAHTVALKAAMIDCFLLFYAELGSVISRPPPSSPIDRY